jgi:glycosyltransferase involved in cell wall biosynthesis
MRVLMISADPALAGKASGVFSRVESYAAEAGEVTVILRAVGGSPDPVSSGALSVLPTASRSKLRSLWDALRLARAAARAGSFDLVTAQDPFEHGLIGWLAARAAGAPLELQAHADFGAPGFLAISRANRLRRWLAKFLVPRAAAVRAVSARVARAALALGARRVSIVPVRAEISALLAAPLPAAWRGEGDFEIVTVSRLAPEKRIERLVGAVAALRAGGLPARLTVIGEGPERPRLEALAAGFGFVRFLGKKDDPFAAGTFHAYAQASAFEGYGLSLLEATARGLPVVTTDVGLVGEVLVDGRSCLVADSSASAAAALERVARDPVLAGRLGEAARAAASSSGSGETVVDAWREALPSPRRLFLATQVLDEDDPVLGFFCRWVDALAARSDSVVVTCLRRGRYAPPGNVRVVSLGKGEGRALPGFLQKLRYAARFKIAAWRERKNYDAVLVHMNPEYLVLAGVIWRLLRRPAFLWYTHKNVDLKLRLAVALARGVFSASAESFRLATPKLRVMGHGIDGEVYSPGSRSWGSGVAGTSGRVSATKRTREIIEAALAAGYRVRVAGGPATADDEPYYAGLVAEFAAEPRVEILGPLPPAAIPEFLRSLDVFVNLSQTGSLDKAVLEAAACGAAVVTSNPAFRAAPGEVFLEESDVASVAAAIRRAASAAPSTSLREWVIREHDLGRLADRLADALYGEAFGR